MNKPTLKEQAHGEIEKIFRILLPQNGLAVREEQITLCHAMLDTLLKNNIALCDAGVGIGKTYAYLTACILLKKFAPHGPAGSQPVVISTSSVALQDAIIGEYIPFLSRIFLENRVISKPIRAIVRKGKERFVCDARLSQRLEAVKDKNKNAEQLKALLSLRTYYDLDSVTGLSGFDRRQVCVPKVCEKTCPLRSACRYHQYLKEARSAEIFVQICNHNYLWRCVNRLEFGTKYCKHSPSLKEPILHQAILNCIQSVFHNKEEIAEAVREAQKKIILFEDAKNNPEVIRQRMQDIDHGMANLLTLAAQSSQTELFEKKFKEMTEEKARLAEQLKQAEEDATTDAKRQKQLDDILRAIDIDIVELTEFDDTFIRRIVEQVTILSKDKIEVRFIGGFSKVGDIPTK